MLPSGMYSHHVLISVHRDSTLRAAVIHSGGCVSVCSVGNDADVT